MTSSPVSFTRQSINGIWRDCSGNSVEAPFPREARCAGDTPATTANLQPACLRVVAPVNSAYGRTGNAPDTEPCATAGSVAAAATKSAHSPDAAAGTAQSCAT